MSAKTKKKKKKQPFPLVVSENIEALAIAIVMALILNQFLIQAYKIPTGSMQPVIMGDKEQGLYDRILVNKFIYLVSEPERWDIIVFKYPLNQSLNYIKRLVGLPGETIEIRDGDIYVDGAMERKPEATVSSVLKEIFPNGRTFKNYFDVEGSGSVDEKDGIAFSGPGKVRVRESIRDRYLDGYDPDYKIKKPFHIGEDNCVGDLRLSFRARLKSGEGGIRVRMREEGREHILFLKGETHPGPSYLATHPYDGRSEDRVWTDAGLSLNPDQEYALTFSNIDDRLILLLDGEEVVRHDYGYAGSDKVRGNDVEFSTEGAGARFDGIRLYRDIYYISGSEPRPYKVPEGHYFALGDNTQTSLDGRLWSATVLTTKTGEEVLGERTLSDRPNVRVTREGYYLIDHFGDQRFLSKADLATVQDSKSMHFVPEELMLGKALVIFWPMVPHFRWNLLR